MEVPMSKIKISASLMCSNPLYLGKEIEALQAANCDGFHIDIIDGHFAENLAMNVSTIEYIKKASSIPLDVHLMVVNPEKYIDRLCDIKVDHISVHVESCDDIALTLKKIKNNGIKAGIAICPDTSYSPDDSIIDNIDHCLFLSVSPGFAGQKFIWSTIEKVNKTYRNFKKNGYDHIDIQVDGHINTETLPLLYAAGATSFVGGSAGLFCGDKDYRKNINALKNCV